MKYSEYVNVFHEQIKNFGIDSSHEEILLIFPYFEKKVFKKGEVFLKEGECCNEAYFIIRGLVRSYQVLPNDNEKTYIICREHNIFTEHSSFMSRKPSTDNLEAMEETEVLFISHENLMNLYKKYHIWDTIGRIICDQNYIVSLARLKSLMNDDALKRYKRYLKSFQNILHRIPQNIVASYLGITPQSFSRLKRELDDRVKIL
jgi:CRP-like cAMP-binding protein